MNKIQQRKKKRAGNLCIEWDDKQLEGAGLLDQKKQILSIGRRLQRICGDLHDLDLRVFVDGTNTICIHQADREPHLDPERDGCVILSIASTPFAGGDW